MENTSPEISRSAQKGALIVACLTSFLAPFMGASVNVAMPAMGQVFGLNPVVLGWVNLAFLLTAASFSLPFGRLGDIYGRKKIFVRGVAIFTAASVAIGFAPTGEVLILGRAVQGVGSAMLYATGMALLISAYPPSDRGRVLGINVAAVYIGLSSGPFLGGIITEYLGWRYLFWINIPLGAMLVGVAQIMLQGEWAEDRGARFDLVGSILFAASLGLTLYAFSSLPKLQAVVMLAIGLAGLAGFVLFELKIAHPLIDVRLFVTNRVFALSSLAALINYAATFAVTYLVSLYLQKVRGFSPNEAGFVLVSAPLVQALLSPWAGRLSDRVAPRIVASIGMASCFLGLILLTFLKIDTPIVYLVGALLFLGLGFALFSSPNTKAIMNAVDRRMFGVASAVVGTMRQMGMTFSMGIVMMILALHLGDAQVKPQNAAEFVLSMKVSFTFFAALCFGGIFASVVRGR